MKYITQIEDVTFEITNLEPFKINQINQQSDDNRFEGGFWRTSKGIMTYYSGNKTIAFLDNDFNIIEEISFQYDIPFTKQWWMGEVNNKIIVGFYEDNESEENNIIHLFELSEEDKFFRYLYVLRGSSWYPKILGVNGSFVWTDDKGKLGWTKDFIRVHNIPMVSWGTSMATTDGNLIYFLTTEYTNDLHPDVPPYPGDLVIMSYEIDTYALRVVNDFIIPEGYKPFLNEYFDGYLYFTLEANSDYYPDTLLKLGKYNIITSELNLLDVLTPYEQLTAYEPNKHEYSTTFIDFDKPNNLLIATQTYVSNDRKTPLMYYFDINTYRVSTEYIYIFAHVNPVYKTLTVNYNTRDNYTVNYVSETDGSLYNERQPVKDLIHYDDECTSFKAIYTPVDDYRIELLTSELGMVEGNTISYSNLETFSNDNVEVITTKCGKEVTSGWYNLYTLQEQLYSHSEIEDFTIYTSGEFYRRNELGAVPFTKIKYENGEFSLYFSDKFVDNRDAYTDNVYFRIDTYVPDGVDTLLENSKGVPVYQAIYENDLNKNYKKIYYDKVGVSDNGNIITFLEGGSIQVDYTADYYKIEVVKFWQRYEDGFIGYNFGTVDTNDERSMVRFNFVNVKETHNGDLLQAIIIATGVGKSNFRVFLQHNESEPEAITKKTKVIKSVDGTLKAGTSVINPTITIEYDGYPEGVDYVTIPLFHRCYFVDDIVSYSYNLWTISLRVDVLSSYDEDIRNSNGFVVRSEDLYNEMIKDSQRDVTDENEIKYELMNTYYFDFHSQFPDREHKDRYYLNYVWNVINNATLEEPYDASLTNLPENLENTSTQTSGDVGGILYVTTYDVTKQILLEVQKLTEPITYIKNVMALPFDMRQIYDGPANQAAGLYKTNSLSMRIGFPKSSNPDDNTNVYPHKNIANQTIENNLCYLNGTSSQMRFKYATFFLPEAKTFLDLPPYTKYEIYIPYLDYIELPFYECMIKNEFTNTYVAKRIDIFYNINFDDGTAFVYLIDEAGNTIYSSKCQVGTKVGVSTNNQQQINEQRTSLVTSTAISTVGTAVGTLAMSVANPVTAPLSIVSGATSIAGGIAKATVDSSLMHVTGRTEITSGNQGLQLPQQACLRISKKRVLDDRGNGQATDKYRKLFGLPTYKATTLDKLNGKAYIDNLIIKDTKATKKEIEEIKILLSQGVDFFK